MTCTTELKFQIRSARTSRSDRPMITCWASAVDIKASKTYMNHHDGGSLWWIAWILSILFWWKVFMVDFSRWFQPQPASHASAITEDVIWTGVVRSKFVFGSTWLLFNLILFVLSYWVDCGYLVLCIFGMDKHDLSEQSEHPTHQAKPVVLGEEFNFTTKAMGCWTIGMNRSIFILASPCSAAARWSTS